MLSTKFLDRAMYIFDTCCLIHAYKDDFPPNGPNKAFWSWFDNLASNEEIIIPEEVLEEIDCKKDGLKKFLSRHTNLKKESGAKCVSALPTVLRNYGDDLSDVDLELLGGKADPYIISHAIVSKGTVVSCEVSDKRKTGVQKKIPDVCGELNVDFESYTCFVWRMRGLYP
ncbi:MAG: DUF4411 family protein [Dehalogenimonas sp.]|jgi:hypothetical protein|uniref:DUF4411 family protein n=1 Tax=Candidatus Dehalogenimonas loeffleri TaxID=3127115 RepID=A0ABZ2J1Y2_9CHLR|nr:DUF4411 family protein [Dehalogenimonas sp.]